MSELTGHFLAQLQKDIVYLSAQAGPASARLVQLSQRIDIDEENNTVPVTLSKEGRVIIHAGHPAVSHLLNNPHRRRSDLVFFISNIMSLLNREEEAITDEHERLFHARLLEFALNECQGSWAGSV